MIDRLELLECLQPGRHAVARVGGEVRERQQLRLQLGRHGLGLLLELDVLLLTRLR